MAPLYSSLLYEYEATVGITPQTVGPPAAGTLWVIRDIVFEYGGASPIFPGASATDLYYFRLNGTNLLTASGGKWVTGTFTDHWQGRQVLDFTEEGSFWTGITPAWIRVSGYVLTYP